MTIKECFIPREGFIFLEADYKQLEIAGLAILSKDKNLIKDINDEVDLHRRVAAKWLHKAEIDITDNERRAAKAISFQLQYGAGYKSIARKQKISVVEAKEFIKTYYNLYPGVKAYHDNLLLEATHNITYRNKKKYGILNSSTGRYWMIPEAMDTSGSAYMPPTKVKNYPVQGFCGGDIVLTMLGILTEQIVSDELYIVNTVHDSILFEIKEVHFIHKIDEILSKTSEYISDIYDIEVPVTIRVEYKIGDNWGTMSKVIKDGNLFFKETE